MKSLLILVGIVAASELVLARPSIVARCQTNTNPYSEVTVCSHEDLYSSDNYGYSIYYRHGLLRESRHVYLGGMIKDGDYSQNLYGGSSDWSDKLLTLNEDGSGKMGVAGGGGRHRRIEVYFHTADGKYDSLYGHNYVFQF